MGQAVWYEKYKLWDGEINGMRLLLVKFEFVFFLKISQHKIEQNPGS